MNRKAEEMELFYLQVKDLLELIGGCDEIIKRMLTIGIKSNDSSIKQELYLKHRYVEEFNQLLESFEISAKIVEKDIELQKAA